MTVMICNWFCTRCRRLVASVELDMRKVHCLCGVKCGGKAEWIGLDMQPLGEVDWPEEPEEELDDVQPQTFAAIDWNSIRAGPSETIQG